MTTTTFIVDDNTYIVGTSHEAWQQTVALGEHERHVQLPAGMHLLRTTDTSPFGRKVRIAAEILGLSDTIAMSPVDFKPTDTALNATNPLGKAPVLETSAGNIYFESSIIVRYLCSLVPTAAPQILPEETAASLLNSQLEAAADGAILAGLARRMERVVHPEEAVSEVWLSRQQGKIERTLGYLKEHISALPFTQSGAIACACLLGYLDWRAPTWRDDNPELVQWLVAFEAAVPAFAATHSS